MKNVVKKLFLFLLVLTMMGGNVCAAEPDTTLEFSVVQEMEEEETGVLEINQIFDEETGEMNNATEYTSTDGFRFYTNYAGNAVISGYTKNVEALIIPAKVECNGTVYSVEGIGEYAFANNDDITSVEIAKGITYIGSYAFQSCDKIKKIMLPSTLKELNSYSFDDCDKLEAVVLPEGLTTIGAYAFCHCLALSEISFPSTLTSIGAYAFENADGLEHLILNEGLEQIGKGAFEFCSALRTVKIPETVRNIGKYAFRQCSNLNSVSLGGGVQKIESYAFAGNPNLKSIYIPRSVTEMETNVFAEYAQPSGLTTVYCEQNSVADNPNNYPSGVVIKYGVEMVQAPTISVSDRVEGKVTIKTETAGSTIYYTTDGSIPSTTNGIKVNSSSVTINSFSGTLKAIAVKSGYANSSVARKVFCNSLRSRNVSFEVKGVIGGRNVTFNSDTKGAKIYYSSTASTLNTSDKCVKVGETVRFEDFYGTIYARTYYNGEWGNVCRLILRIPVVNTPSIELLNNGYAILSTTTPRCTIYYTLDGSTPSPTNGRKLNTSRGKVYVGKGNTIKVIAVRSCFTNSEVASCTN